MFLAPPLKSSAAMRAASTEPMPLVSWKIPEMSLSTPTRTTLPEISACASDAAQDSASMLQSPSFFMVSLPSKLLVSGRFDRDGQTFETAQRIVVAALHLAGDFDRLHLARQRRHHHLTFKAGDELPDAHVNAGAIADMTGGAAGDVIAVGVLPAARIAVGGAEEHQHLLALADAVAAKLDLARGGTEEGLHRALEADRFLEGVARQRGIAAQFRQLLREARQAIDRCTNAVDGCIEPGRQQRTH